MTSVIIPSRNVDNLKPCIRAIHEHEAESDLSIVVVDDGLAEKPPEYVGDLSCLTVPGVKPFVFSRNINIGIRAAGNDDVILLNDDALLKTPGGFSALARIGAEHPEYGVIAAATNSAGNPNQRPAPGGGLRDEPRMVCFVCVFISRKTLDIVGLLDERFVDYGADDDDCCLRARKAGLKIGVFDGCFVDHASLQSTYRGGPGKGGDYTANLRRFKEKWGFDNFGR